MSEPVVKVVQKPAPKKPATIKAKVERVPGYNHETGEFIA